MTWVERLFEFLAGMLTKVELSKLTTDDKAIAGAVTIAVTPPTFSETRDVEEDRQRATVVAYMRSQKGDKYKYGAEILPGHEYEAEQGDCSEYNEAAFRVAGKFMPDGVVNQRAHCRRVKTEALKPADLVILKPNAKGIPHVMVCSGEGTVIHALGGVGVVEQPIWDWLNHVRFDGVWRHPEWARPPEERA